MNRDEDWYLQTKSSKYIEPENNKLRVFHPFSPDNILDISPRTNKSFSNIQDVIDRVRNGNDGFSFSNIYYPLAIDEESLDNYMEDGFLSLSNVDPALLVPVKNLEYSQSNTVYTNSYKETTPSQYQTETFRESFCSFDEIIDEYFQEKHKKLNNLPIDSTRNLKKSSSITKTTCKDVEEDVNKICIDIPLTQSKKRPENRKRPDTIMNQFEYVTDTINRHKKIYSGEDSIINELNKTEFKVYLNDFEISEPLSGDVNKQIILKFEDGKNYSKIKYKSKEYKDIYNDSNLSPIFYSFHIPIFIFEKINIQIIGPYKYISINRFTKEFCLNQIISGIVYFKNADKISSPDRFIFLKNTPQYNYSILLSMLFKTRFPIFDFSKCSRGNRIAFGKTLLGQSQIYMSLEEFFMKFEEFSILFFLMYESTKYKDIDEISTINTTRIKDLPNDSWKGGIFLITKFTIELHKNIEELKKIIANPLNEELESNERDIGIIINNILLKERPEWCVTYFFKHRNIWSYEEDILISFYIFYHREVWLVLKHWSKYNFTNEKPKYIEPQNLQVTHCL